MDQLDRIARDTLREHDERSREDAKAMQERIRYRMFGFYQPEKEVTH